MSARVVVSNHAFNRWPERVGWSLKRTKLQRMMVAKVNNALARGLKMDKTGAGYVQIDRHTWAVVRLRDDAWVVTTFVTR